MPKTNLEPRMIEALLRGQDDARLTELLADRHPADLGALIDGIATAGSARLLGLLPVRTQAEVFGYLALETRLSLAATLDRKTLAQIVSAMPHDERVDLFADIPDTLGAALMPALAQAERDDLLRLAAWPEGTVGSVMTSDYATLPPDQTAREAMDHLRKIAPDSETIYYSYVVDHDSRLIGVVRLRKLLMATDEAKVRDVMAAPDARIRAGAPREQAVELIRKYDLLAIPVTDDDGRLVGIVTYDDAMDVAQETETQRFEKTSAVGNIGTDMLRASIGLLYRKRVPWLTILVFGNIFSGAGIAYFEDTIAAYVALVFFLPLLVDSGGNAGSQSATLMVRAMATGNVRLSDWSRMLGREVLVAGALGLTMALAVSGIGLWRGGPEIALVVALTMIIIVITGSLIGMSLPFVLSKFRLDPAAASAPLVTSLADAIGVIIYFAMATWILGV